MLNNKMFQQLSRAVALIVLLISTNSQAAHTRFTATESCARSEAEIFQNPDIANAVKMFGGMPNILGEWKLSGMAGVIMKTNVDLQSDAAGFTVNVNKAEVKQFWLCVDSTAKDVLRMHIQKAVDPDAGLLLLKVDQPGDSVMVAAAKSKWKFMKFKRVDSFD